MVTLCMLGALEVGPAPISGNERFQNKYSSRGYYCADDGAEQTACGSDLCQLWFRSNLACGWHSDVAQIKRMVKAVRDFPLSQMVVLNINSNTRSRSIYVLPVIRCLNFLMGLDNLSRT